MNFSNNFDSKVVSCILCRSHNILSNFKSSPSISYLYSSICRINEAFAILRDLGVDIKRADAAKRSPSRSKVIINYNYNYIYW